MKRIIVLLLCALALAAGASANTNIWQDKIYIDGEFRIAYLSDKNVPDSFAPAGTMQSYDILPARLFLGAGYRPSENINIFARGVFFTLWGRDGGLPFFTESQVDRVQLAEGYGELKNIFNAVDIKIGRQFYYDDQVWFMPKYDNFENLVYTSLDGATASIRIKATQIRLMAGWRARLSDWDDHDYFTYGFETKTDIKPEYGFYAFFYNSQKNSDTYEGVYGLKPYVNYKGIAASFRYLRVFDDGRAAFPKHGQFFMGDISYEINAPAAMLKPRASVAWTTGSTDMNIYFERSLIIEHIYGPTVLRDTAVYNAGIDIAPAALPKLQVLFDGYYYQGRANGNPDKGLELDLQAKYNLLEDLTIGAGFAYLFADRDFQSKDAQKIQVFAVYKF